MLREGVPGREREMLRKSDLFRVAKVLSRNRDRRYPTKRRGPFDSGIFDRHFFWHPSAIAPGTRTARLARGDIPRAARPDSRETRLRCPALVSWPKAGLKILLHPIRI